MVREVSTDTPDSCDAKGVTFKGRFYEPSEAAQVLLAIQMEQLFLLRRIESILIKASRDS